MRYQIRFWLIYLGQIIGYALLLLSLFITFVFIKARPINKINLGGKSLPTSWEAACRNGDKHLHCFLFSRHPLYFAFAVLILIGTFLFNMYLSKEIKRQISDDGPEFARAHKIAENCTFAALMLMCYIMVFHILVGVRPFG